METKMFNPVTTLLGELNLNVTDVDSYTKESKGMATMSYSTDKSRLELFFRELTDLIRIDNAYRGILS
ncbi:hypothetical protein FACS1894145_0310 [Bacteroidia bacterium]|nr:hypothetical protein FACS1894145_0310 [Bacteroidia bacterium]